MEVNPVQQIITVSDMRYHPEMVHELAQNGEVLVTKNGRPWVVAVSIEHWNEISVIFHLMNPSKEDKYEQHS